MKHAFQACLTLYDVAGMPLFAPRMLEFLIARASGPKRSKFTSKRTFSAEWVPKLPRSSVACLVARSWRSAFCAAIH